MLLSIFSCVPSRQFDDLKAKYKQCDESIAKLKSENQELVTKNTELLSLTTELQKRTGALEKDTTIAGSSSRRLTELYNELTKSYDKLLSNNEKLLAGNTDETKKVISKLNDTQEELQKKEDELKKLARNLSEKEKNLNELNDQLTTSQKELQQRETKLKELQSILNKKDSTVNALKNTVANALLGFQDKGLSVTQKNGKVYVSLEERLLFASGSTAVDPKGQEALKQLAKVLEKNSDINIMIEGHTDNVPFTTGGTIKDNWDLSVMRATSVLKIITNNSKLDPQRLTAAGRGDYLPIDAANTAEARKKNRRTEIILTPKLDELLKVLETN